MCKLKSLILLKDRVFCPEYDSHDSMLKELGIEDTRKNAERLFVRVEVSPISLESNDIWDINKWEYRVEQDILPNWYVKEIDEERARNAVKYWAKTHIITGLVQKIDSGSGYIICGNAIVHNILGNANVYKICDNAKVFYIYDNAKVSNIFGNAKVSNIFGKANVSKIYGNAEVSDIFGNANVYKICDNAKVSAIYDNAEVSKLCGDAEVSDLCGDAIIDYVKNTAKIFTIRSHAIVKGDSKCSFEQIKEHGMFITEDIIYVSKQYKLKRCDN